MKFAVVVFPGSNCDHDAYYAVRHVLGQEAAFVWHKETGLGGADVVIVPGGFSHGDYLRTGAIARFSPVMAPVQEFAARGGPVLGICNGFQILLECGLLPGAMLRNRDLKFHCEHVGVRVEQLDTPFTGSCRRGQVLRLPIAHGEGNYYAPPDVLGELEAAGRIVFRYATPQGEATDAANPNGSVDNIAGICNAARNVVGLMPHPERACESSVGSTDGLALFESVVACLSKTGTVQPRPAAVPAPRRDSLDGLLPPPEGRGQAAARATSGPDQGATRAGAGHGV
jgi:phosphoribosylformylglycinamidine synthase